MPLKSRHAGGVSHMNSGHVMSTQKWALYTLLVSVGTVPHWRE